MQTLNEFNNFHKSIHYLQELPPVAQNEAFDFIEFLRKKYNVSVEYKSKQRTTNKAKKRQAGRLTKTGRTLDPAFFEPLDDEELYVS